MFETFSKFIENLNFFLKVSDEDEILPPKLQAALMQILEERNEILAQEQNFSQGKRQMIWGLKDKAVNIYWVPSTLLADI